MNELNFPLGILDQSPIVSDASACDAIDATIALARRADALGFARFWLSEHHAMAGLADATPEILIARLSAETSRIRLGTGGVMLPHTTALKVAETFRMLEALAPGRIDLGVGRAPGGSGMVAAALESRDAAQFPRQIVDTIDFLGGTMPATHPFARVRAMPRGTTMPQVWLLGSSEYGALLAAELGLPYNYAHFIGGDAPHITKLYRDRFVPSMQLAAPRVSIAFAAIIAPTDAEAQALSWPVALWRMRRLRGIDGPVPSLAETEAYPWTPRERDEAGRTRRTIAAAPANARRAIDALVTEYGADEALLVTITPDYASRVRSFELIAEAYALARTPV